MTKEIFIKAIQELNVEYTNDMLEKLDKYMNYLIEYNEHTNLTAIKTPEEIYLKHFYDSLTIVKAHNFNDVKKLIDIGTGAGFPGMVLKIFYPHLEVTLLDSNNKKTKFLKNLADIINVDVTIINDRIENFSKTNINSFDVVTSRAVANLRVLAELSLPLVKEHGLFIPMKGNIERELNDAKDTISILSGNIKKVVSFELFNQYGIRNILIIEKVKETNIKSIRTYDKIVKKPLKFN